MSSTRDKSLQSLFRSLKTNHSNTLVVRKLTASIYIIERGLTISICHLEKKTQSSLSQSYCLVGSQPFSMYKGIHEYYLLKALKVY